MYGYNLITTFSIKFINKKSTPSKVLFSISKYQIFLIKLSSIINHFRIVFNGFVDIIWSSLCCHHFCWVLIHGQICNGWGWYWFCGFHYKNTRITFKWLRFLSHLQTKCFSLFPWSGEPLRSRWCVSSPSIVRKQFV